MITLAQQIGITAEHAQAISARGFDLLGAGDLDGASDIFIGLLVLNPNDVGVQSALGAVFHEQGRLREAEAAYDAAIRIERTTPLARVNRGELRCRRGDPGGLEDLQIAARFPSAVQARAQALVRLYAR